jgi:aminopeptidase N
VDFINYGKEGVFHLKQVHETNDLVGLFKMPINFEVYYADGSADRKRVWVEDQAQRISFDLELTKKVDYVLFDPNSEVMKKVTFNKSTEMLLSQAEKAEQMIDRYDAIVALGERSFEGKSDYLLRRFIAEDFYGIKNEIIKQLMPQMDEKSLEIIKLALADEDSDVRKAALENTVRISTELEPEYRKLLRDSSYQVIEKTLELLAFYYSQHMDEYFALTSGVKGDRSHNVAITRHKLAYANNGNAEDLEQLVDFTSNSYEFLTRVKAAKALKEVNVLNEKALSNMLNATFSFNRRLSGPVSSVINHFYEQREFKQLIFDYVTAQEWDSDEFKKVSKYYLP